MEKTLTILRGVSGSGKSSFARYIQSVLCGTVPADFATPVENWPVVCSADQYFTNVKIVNGKPVPEYNFDASKLPEAHESCKKKVHDYMSKGYYHIIVDNTSTSEWEIDPYMKFAKKFGYRVFSVVVENRHGNTTTHNVPEETLVKQESRIRNSLKLR